MSKQTFTEPWKKIAQTWKNFSDNSRPSKQNIKDFERFILPVLQKDHPKVLVMGSTPELRDMLARHSNVAVTTLDANQEMTKAMTELMTEKTDREEWVKGDWLDMPFEDNTFDAVVADYIKGNIPFKKQSLLYKQIARVLKPDGIFVERMFSRFPHSKTLNVEDVIEKYSKLDPTYRTAEELWGYLMYMTHDDIICPSDRPFEILKKYEDVPNMKEYTTLIHNLVGPGKVWEYGRPWEEDKKPVTEHFEIVDKAEDDTLFKDWTYIFKMKPKNK